MITIAIADDHDIVRVGLKAILETDSELTVIGEAASGEKALMLVKETHPDILLLDLYMESRDTGLTIIQKIIRERSKTQILSISMLTGPGIVRKVLGLGARGFLSKHEVSEYLIEAIHAVHEGNIFLAPTSQTPTKTRQPGELSILQVYELLTKREIEVMNTLATGRNVKEVAEELHITNSTVSTHIENIKFKLSFSSIEELTLYAIAWHSHLEEGKEHL
ncbi:MAG: response regulator transcription factor [Sphaerochaetaceae bacterium]|nr:response regulator transcription factor [Sphaerochaetaceae bacterium]